ncbi:eglA, partial [Symbiodinium microadriaticum]
MQTQIQQAVSDLGINLEDYGRKGKGTTRNKGKGKGKRPERNEGYQSDMYRNQAEEEEDTEEDYKPKGGKGSWRKSNNYWDRSSSSRDTGKGSHSQWDDYRRPASSRVDYAGPKDRPDKWWKARDFAEYDPRFDDLVQDSTQAELCDGGQTPSFYGHGKCAACKALRMYYIRLYGGDDAEAINPYYHTLIVGYERSIIEYLEDTTAKLQQALCDLTYEDLHDKQPTDVQNWFSAIAFPEDILAKLPRTYVDPKYEPHKSSFLRTKWPEWKHLNRAIGDANPHSYSRMMMLFEAALRPAMEEMLYCFDLPSPSRVTGFADMGWDDSTLVVQDLIPWRELIRQSYALAMERWLSLATSQLANMALFEFSSLLEWYRLLDYFLQLQWK